MKKYRELQTKQNNAIEKINKNLKSREEMINTAIKNTETRLKVMEKLPEIISDIDKEFTQKTGIINKKDQIFLWTAVALQISKTYLINELTNIEKAGKGRNEIFLNTKQKKFFKNFKTEEPITRGKYFSSFEEIIITKGVPYDITNGGKKFKIFKGGNHRFATLGHDPILGYVFGTANILTNTITSVNPIFSTYHIEKNGNTQEITTCASTLEMFSKVLERFENDKKSVVAALIKQTIHIMTDLYTPAGIQIPVANLMLSIKNTEQLTKYISFGDVVKIGISAKLSQFINYIISVIHNILYDEEKDSSRELYQVRTWKIIAVSNAIASSTNMIFVGAKFALKKDVRNLKQLDIGAYIVTFKEIIKSKKLQEEIRRIYLEEKLYEKFLLNKDMEVKNEQKGF